MPGAGALSPSTPQQPSPPLPSHLSKRKVLCLFGGPSGRSDGVEKSCEKRNAEAIIIDWVNDPRHDLLNDAFYYDLLGRVKADEFYAALIATPCETFSAAREVLPGESYGPRALRGPQKPDLYGKRDLTKKEREVCRKGTLLAVRSAEIAAHFKSTGKPWLLENPWQFKESAPSVFNLDEIASLFDDPADHVPDPIILERTDQCMDGADCCKPTGLAGPKSCLLDFGRRCDHPMQWWVYHDYHWVQAPHAPLRRKNWTGAPCPRQVLPEDWYQDMPSHCDECPTQAKKAYPGPLNDRLMGALLGDVQTQ